ncbi:MAG: cupin domain-containing protein [Planctomycetaceae bacterium]
MQFIQADSGSFVPASHEDPGRPGVLKRVIATNRQLQRGRVQMLNWSRLPAESSFRPHYHEDMQEIFVLLTGQVMMRCGDDEAMMQPGDTVIVEPREVHEMTNLLQTDAEYLVFGISSEEGGRTVVVG